MLTAWLRTVSISKRRSISGLPEERCAKEHYGSMYENRKQQCRPQRVDGGLIFAVSRKKTIILSLTYTPRNLVVRSLGHRPVVFICIELEHSDTQNHPEPPYHFRYWYTQSTNSS